GQPRVFAVGPVGVSGIVGAANFGFGMQLGGGCGSATLFTVGGGSARMLVTLAFFIVGAVLGTAHLPWWLLQPNMGIVDLRIEFGLPAAIGVTVIGLSLVAIVSAVIEKRAHGNLESEPEPRRPGWSW